MQHTKHHLHLALVRLMLLAVVAAAMAISPSTPVAAATPATLFDLGAFLGDNSEAFAINNNGEVVGFSINAAGEQSGFHWKNGESAILLRPLSTDVASIAKGINDKGQIVGVSIDSAGQQHAVRWETSTSLPTFLGPGFGEAYDINTSGDIVGVREGRAVIWLAGKTPSDPLATMFGINSSTAKSINDAGRIVGTSENSGGSQAILWPTYSQNPQVLPPPFMLLRTTAVGINTNGQIAGTASENSVDGTKLLHLVRWQDNKPDDLGDFGGNLKVSGINDAGQIVGQHGDHAFLWQDGAMTDLGTLIGGRGKSSAVGINNAGQVVGWSDIDELGRHHAFVTSEGNGGSISGRVTDPSGNPPMGQVFVEACLSTPGNPCAKTGTDSMGQYTLIGLADGEYKVTARPSLSDVFQLPNNITVVIQNGDNHPGQDIQLKGGQGSISGRVLDPRNMPVEGATVDVCLEGGFPCTQTKSDSVTGQYMVTGLIDGRYTVKASPPANVDLLPNSIVVDVNGMAVPGKDILLTIKSPLPSNAGISPNRNNAELPIVHWEDKLALYASGCDGSARYWISQGNKVLRSGNMDKHVVDPTNIYYTADVEPLTPDHGYATVSITINCDDGSTEEIEFTTYIDPSGNVRTVGGAPIVGATVTLLHSVSELGPFEVVPDGDPIMSLANRTNPDKTDAAGHFGWDVAAGYYIVRAQKAGCSSPTDPAQPFVQTDVLEIPPPVTDLDLRLACETTPPVIICDNPDRQWHAGDVRLACTASDAEAGLANPADASFVLTTNVVAGRETAQATTDTRTVCDSVGNCATAGPIGGNKVDKRAPRITIQTPAPGAGYILKQTVAARYQCSDDGSGVAACAGSVANGRAIDTRSVGAHTFIVTTADHVGNTRRASVTYNVNYDFSGFLRPVKNLPALNKVRAGHTVSVRFSLHGDQGLNIFAKGYPKSQVIRCGSGALVNGTDAAVTPRSRGFTYNAHTDQYRFRWQTDSAWAGTCRQLVIRLKDGTYHRLNFMFPSRADADTADLLEETPEEIEAP